jgi:uncharacterized protein
MIIEVAKLPDEPLELDCRVPWQEVGFVHPDARLRQDIELTARITLLEEQTLRVQGSCQTDMEFTCCRCLQVFAQPQSLKFDLFYMPHSTVGRHVEELELRYEDLDLGFYDGLKLDTDVILSEQLVFAVPMKPLCSNSCKGLCPQCGINLNFGQCQCPVQDVNPMQEKLQDFKKYLEEKRIKGAE